MTTDDLLRLSTLTGEELELVRPPKDAIDLFIVELVRILGYRKAHTVLFGYPPRYL